MPINVIGNSSHDNNIKIDTSLFVQKLLIRSDYIDSNIEENIDMKNQYEITNLADPLSIREACSENYVDQIFRNDIDFKDVNLEKIEFVKVNYQPAVGEHLTPKVYVDNAIDEATLSRKNRDNNFNGYKLININIITLNTQAVNDNQVLTKSYVHQFHDDNERNRRDVVLSFYNEEADLVKNIEDNDLNGEKLTNIDSITVNRNPSLDEELANKKYIDDELDKNTIVRFNQTLQNYLKVSLGNDTYNLTKYDKMQNVDTTFIQFPNVGGYLFENWVIKGNDKKNNSKIQIFLRSTNTNNPSSHSGAESLPPISNASMYIESSGNNHGYNVFCSFERTIIIQISNISFYYNKFSILTGKNLKKIGRFRIQLLLEDNTWSTQYTIAKNTHFTDSPTEWNLLNLDFTVKNYGIILILDQIDTAHSDVCFSNITITHSVY